jgi:hypothetical protein
MKDDRKPNTTERASLPRRNVLLGGTSLATASTLLPAAHAQQPPPESGRPPNILVIFGDDIGQTNISAYTFGLKGYRTPNIDRIAREGMMFTVLGQDRLIECMLIGLLADGNLLLESLTGLAKTRTVKTLAKNLAADLSRIQFTPDAPRQRGSAAPAATNLAGRRRGPLAARHAEPCRPPGPGDAIETRCPIAPWPPSAAGHRQAERQAWKQVCRATGMPLAFSQLEDRPAQG